MNDAATQPKSEQQLLVNYLNIANAAMESHQDDFPYKQLHMVGDKLFNDKKFGVGIVKDDPRHPYDYYTVAYKNGAFQLVGHGKKDADLDWHCKRDYLEEVVANPNKYIESPAKLDWDWLKSFLH